MVVNKRLNTGHKDRSFWKEHGGLSYNNRKKYNKSLNIKLREEEIQFIDNKIKKVHKKLSDIDQYHCGETPWIGKSIQSKNELKTLNRRKKICENHIKKIKSGKIDLGVGGCRLT